MKGQANLDALKDRVANNTLNESDRPLLGLIELARLDLNQLADPGRTETLLAKLEAAEKSAYPEGAHILVPEPTPSDEVRHPASPTRRPGGL